MQRLGSSSTRSVIFALGAALGLATVGAETSSKQNPDLHEFPANVGRHVKRVDPESALGLQNPTPTPAQSEAGPLQTAPPTRSCFMASWQRVSGAIGYRLDVSKNSSFSSYVNGYHDLEVGNVNRRAVTGLSQGATYYYRVGAYDATATTTENSGVMTATTSLSAGLVINATFDFSITSNPNATAIEAMINRAISIYESLFSDPITVSILFRYSTTAPDGTRFTADTISESDYGVYPTRWNTYINALVADASTSSDATANASLPTTPLSANVGVSSANGRALALNTPPTMSANGSVANGGPYDGIVSLNSAAALQFDRPTGASAHDAQTSTEHEIDEILGVGSHLGSSGSDLSPQDLFSWSSAGVRNRTSSGTRYFSINGGTTDIMNFNQDSSGDFGDWQSPPCPQVNPLVQNAFGCPGQSADISASSPEGISLDVIGYNLIDATAFAPSDFNGDGKSDIVWQNTITGQRLIWIMNGTTIAYAVNLPTEPTSWSIAGTGDFNGDGQADIIWQNTITGQRLIWIMNGTTIAYAVNLPTEPTDWSIVAP